MCSKEAFPFHLIYLKFPFFLPVPAPDGLHIIQVAGSCLCFWQAKAKDLLCVISWTPGVALQITKRDARFLHSCHFHIFPQLFIVLIWVISGQFSSHSGFAGTKGFACEQGGCSSCLRGAHPWWKLQPQPPYSIVATCTSHPMGKFHTSAASHPGAATPTTTPRTPWMKTQVSWAAWKAVWPAGWGEWFCLCAWHWW